MNREILIKNEWNKQIRKEQEDFYEEIKKCENCKIQRGDRKTMCPENYCSYHQEVYREMEGYVI